jgi:hypothetical protein
MMKRVTTLIASAALIGSFGVSAADKETVLTSVQMPVMVNQGQAYVEASESMLLYPGDQLMVMKGGSAQVHYANGCVQELGANEIAQVGTGESCTTASSAGTHQQVGGTSGGGSSPSGVEWAGIAGIALVGGYIVCEAAEIGGCDDDDDDRPAVSP